MLINSCSPGTASEVKKKCCSFFSEFKRVTICICHSVGVMTHILFGCLIEDIKQMFMVLFNEIKFVLPDFIVVGNICPFVQMFPK